MHKVVNTPSPVVEPPATSIVDVPIAHLARRFDDGLAEIRQEFDLPGITAAYALPQGQVVAFAVGLADKESGAEMTTDARMLSSSVGKTFVGATIMALVQEGKLSLDDKIERWLSDKSWFADLPNRNELTVRHLLKHRGGLGDHVGDPQLIERARQGRREFGADFCFSPDELVQFIVKREPLFAPGAGFAYSDTGFTLLGMIIERAGGATYHSQIQQRFLAPLGLTLTEPANRRELGNLATGHLSPDNAWGLPEKSLEAGKLNYHPANESTGGGLVSNPQDLARWAKALYEGRALPEPYVDELVATGRGESDSSSGYGLGIVVTKSSLGTSYGHGGRFFGYMTHVAYYPKQRVAVAIQVNTDRHPDILNKVRQLTRDVLDTVASVGN